MDRMAAQMERDLRAKYSHLMVQWYEAVDGWAFFSRVKFLVFAGALKVAWIGQMKADC
ncbi:hypothetical protein PF005_g28202 [Phytophthora fragariae]|uniref:Uncharacterized protein n=1 Tax=Phytophthora fragariae TaxID=53985 RepID=A0A6A3QJU0_9STRA|nr:hypothetical protein PF003_g17422 [Phytophthora fragariae]KAE8921018.1 hypothetical protein PF009_g28697 [Phytophthora fragariae]KAE8968292.1 hypothetical protein PF011_g27231 [Phytophthora fragariae]KAE9066831.1 hypothetical protein PF010_g27712 [Phytophthora fragariae]KAE9067356.1 hypothetical protein PF007_g28103 [Phytophthora fragariae]